MSFAFGIKIETDKLPTDLLYPYSSHSLSPTNAYFPGSEFFSLLDSKIEGSGDISMESNRSAADMDVEVTAREPMAENSMEADGGKIVEEMRRTGSRHVDPERTDAEGAAKVEDHSSNHNDLRSSGEEVGSSAANKALTDDRFALSSNALLSEAVGDRLQSSSETAGIGDDPKTALVASIPDDLTGLSSKELDQLAGSSLGGNDGNLGGNDGNANIPDSSDLPDRYLKPTVHNILREGASGAELLKTGAGGNISGSAKLVVVDLRASRGGRKTERESERREPAVRRSRSRASVLGLRASVSDLEARRLAGIGDTQDIQKSEEADSNGAQARLLARIGNRELKEGFQSERFGRSSFESRGSMVERFKEALRNEVVRRSSIILKDEGRGELRLILKPETLGNVRIRLVLNNNHIEGRIIVENSTVKEMFESNLQNLNNAFQREGFSSSSLEVFVSGGNEQKRQREMQLPSFSAAQEFENTVPIQDEYFSEDRVINIIV